MLDIKRIRSNPDEVQKALNKRKGVFDLSEILELDEKRRELLSDVEQKKAHQNKVSKQIPLLKKEGKDASEVLKEMKELSEEVKALDEKVRGVDEEIQKALLSFPNIPNEEVPVGDSDEDNIEVRRVLKPREFDFEIKPHWDLGTNLDILDFERAGKVTGARFSIFKGKGARLERALINFMLNQHTGEHGYTEISTPFMVNRTAMTGTGQLPKFEEDAFRIVGKDYFLVPTAEVPVTNYHAGEILEEEDLPVRFAAYSPCFRQEAGAAGRDNRGLIRNHQFDKVELVQLAHPDESDKALEKLVGHAENILKLLELPYRMVTLCSGDLGFSSTKTYDLEVWMPSYNRYVEISSCSNFEDFQARRANIRFRDHNSKKPRFVHTLNGSGLAVGRTLAAILENYQNEDGSITIPKVLRHYFGGQETI